MTKSKTTRALLAATCVAAAACVSGPQQREPPKPAECPPGSNGTLARFKLIPGSMHRITIHPFDYNYPDAFLSEGEVTAEFLTPFGGDFPEQTRLLGEVFFGTGHLYGRFTQARLPDGALIPVCMEIVTTQGLGIAMEPGSTSKKARVSNIMSVRPVRRFR